MIKLKDAVEKYGEYEIDESRIEEFLVKPKPKSVWDLKKGDIYYFINDRGTITYTTWSNDSVDILRRNIGNIFLTSKEAEFEAERQKVEAEMLKLGGTRDMMSLGNGNVVKYCIEYDDTTKRIRIAQWSTTNYQGCIYFQTNQDCREAIDMIGEDVIKKYIFNVKE